MQAAPPAPPPDPKQLPQPRPSRVGTIIQRSDRENERKRQLFLVEPPPPPARRASRPFERPPPPPAKIPAQLEPEILRPITASPSLRVEIEPGNIVEVPHFAVYVSRQYKARTPRRRWILCFSRDGQLRYYRKIERAKLYIKSRYRPSIHRAKRNAEHRVEVPRDRHL